MDKARRRLLLALVDEVVAGCRSNRETRSHDAPKLDAACIDAQRVRAQLDSPAVCEPDYDVLEDRLRRLLALLEPPEPSTGREVDDRKLLVANAKSLVEEIAAVCLGEAPNPAAGVDSRTDLVRARAVLSRARDPQAGRDMLLRYLKELEAILFRVQKSMGTRT